MDRATMTVATMNPQSARAESPLIGHARYGVLGAGLSGIGAARLMRSMGSEAVIFDDSPREPEGALADSIEAGVGYEKVGGDDARRGAQLDRVDALIVSPGVGSDHPLVALAEARGMPVGGELELAWLHSGRARIAAVTGTNGKTTVTMLIRHLLQSAGRDAVEAGNIGHAFSEAVREAGEGRDRTAFVVEASSFQLERADRFAPDVALLLNITPDHLDRHGSLEAYGAAKARIAARQSAEQILIINQDDPACLAAARGREAEVWRFSLRRPVDVGAWLDEDRLTLARPGAKPARLCDLEDITLHGMHNVANCLAAACAGAALGLGRKQIAAGLRTFGGVRHRLQEVAAIGAVRFINDSKATNIDAMEKAVRSFNDPIHLIAGGRDKGSPFGAVLPALRGRVARAYLIGEAADPIARAWGGEIEIEDCGTLDRALDRAAGRAAPGEIVLLAPGCASFDQFPNFARRGDAFIEWVERRARAGESATPEAG